LKQRVVCGPSVEGCASWTLKTMHDLHVGSRKFKLGDIPGVSIRSLCLLNSLGTS